MSKRSKEKKPAPLADWEVTFRETDDRPLRVQDFPQSRWKRSKPGWCTVRDGEGVVAEFAPGVVLKVRRLDVIEPPSGPAILPVTPHGGE